MVDVLVLFLTASAADVVAAYDSFAGPRGWRVGSLFAAPGSWLKMMAFLGMLLVPWKAWFLFGWVAALGVFAAGFIGAFALVVTLRERVQILAAPLLPLGLIATVLLGTKIVTP